MDVEVIVVEEDERGHLTGPAARAALTEHPELFAVVASAGTTNGGVVDDIADIADVCTQFDVWLHVDGAYGGAGLAAPSVRWRFHGIERAHSFIVDPHKWLFAPYDCCALVYRDVALARGSHRCLQAVAGDDDISVGEARRQQVHRRAADEGGDVDRIGLCEYC